MRKRVSGPLRKTRAAQTWFIHMTHDISHEELDPKLPNSMSLGYDGVEIGEGVIIGAKSFVNRDCIEPGIYVGVPARKTK